MAEVKLPIEAEEIIEPEASEPQLGEPIAKLAQVFELPPKIEKLLMPISKPA